jgi:hypothetical protein
VFSAPFAPWRFQSVLIRVHPWLKQRHPVECHPPKFVSIREIRVRAFLCGEEFSHFSFFLD